MAIADYFEFSSSDIARERNIAAEMVIAQLVDSNKITAEVGEEFLKENTFVAVRNTSLTSRIKQLLFTKTSNENSYLFPLVKVLK